MAGEDEVTVTAGAPLSRDELRTKLAAKGYPPAMVEGMLRNILRESGGSTSIMGDHGTSGGLFQHHAERLDEGKAYAKAQGKPWNNADAQIDFADEELKTKFPELRKELMSETDPARAEDKFKRIFERPASVMWSSNASGGPLLGTDRFRFSDYAMGENRGRNSSLMYMSPDDYLALSPEFQGDHLNDRSRKSLLSSVNKGDEIDSVPSLDVRVKGPTATVTGQDGRHRAYMAVEEGLDQIPVAINQTGQGSPSEITGMQGNTLPMNFQPADKVSRQPSERGLLGRVMDTIVPSAHAEQRPPPDDDDPYAKWVKPADDDPYAKWATPAADAQPQAATQQSAQQPPEPSTSVPGIAASVGRGLAPYAAGAAAGAGIGALLGGVGAIPGAVAGAGAVALSDMAAPLTHLFNKGTGLNIPTFREASDWALDHLGIRRPQTGIERLAATTAAGVGGAGASARLAEMLASTLTQPAAKAAALQLAQNPMRQALGGGTGAFSGQLAAEAGFGPLGEVIAGLFGSGVPFRPYPFNPMRAFSPRQNNLNPFSPRINASEAAKEAVRAGFVIPPADATEGHIGGMNALNIAAADAGKIKLGQLAAAKNQPVVNQKVKEDLGLDPTDPQSTLTPEKFKEIRAREGEVYKEVAAAVPEVDLARDPEFRAAAGKVGSPSAETERLFPSTKQPPGVDALRQELLANARGGTDAVMKYIADLRFNATKNFQKQGDAQAARLGSAQREAATTLEDAMERSVQNAPKYYKEKLDEAVAERGEVTADLDYIQRAQNQVSVSPFSEMGRKIEALRQRVAKANGAVKDWQSRLDNANAKDAYNQTLVERFRNARKMMAKSYDVESVTNVSTGDVSATGLGRLLQRGRPFTGNLKLVADSANRFRRAFQNPAAFGGVEPLSILDVAVAGTMAVHGHPIAAASIAARPFVRKMLLTPGVQKRMIGQYSDAGDVLPSVPLASFSGITAPAIEPPQ